MNKNVKRVISIVLLLVFTFSILPSAQNTAYAAEPDVYMLKNDYISVNVSLKNGGFYIATGEGNKQA